MTTHERGNGSINISAEDVHSLDNMSDYWNDLYYDEYNKKDKTYYPSPIDVLSIVLSVLGIITNILSICIVKRVQKKLTTHLKLVINLCFSDCLILVSSFLKNIFRVTQRVNVCFNVAARLVTDLALVATLLNLLAISLDHYLAILKPFMYKKEVTNIRSICAVLIIWIISILSISIEIVIGSINKKEMEPLCQAIAYDKANSEFGIVTFIFVVLIVIFIIYVRIYICIVRNRSAHSNRRHRQNDSSNIKALVTTSLFVFTFVFFWAPIGIFNAYMYIKDEEYIIENFENIVQIGELLYLILLLNAIADPVIYTFRLPQVYRRCFTCNTNNRRQPSKMITFTSETRECQVIVRSP